MRLRNGLVIIPIVGFGLLLGTMIADASSSFGSHPTELSTKEGVYNTDLYTTDFNHINDFETTITGGGQVGVQNGFMKIFDPVLSFQYATSRDVYMTRSFYQTCPYPSYIIELEFTPQFFFDHINEYSWFLIIRNGDIEILIDTFDNYETWIFAWSQNTKYLITQVGFSDFGSTAYKIHIEIFSDNSANGLSNKYTIKCNDEWVFDVDEAIPISGNTDVNQFQFGGIEQPPGENGYGRGTWNYFDVYGCSAGKFFDNFADGSINDWSDFNVDEESQIRVLSDFLEFDPRDTVLWFDTRNDGNHLGWVQTSYIDYNPDTWYRIDIDFIHYGGDISDFVLVDNGQMRVLIDDWNLVYDDGTNKVIAANLQNNHWYYLSLESYPFWDGFSLTLDTVKLFGGNVQPFFSDSSQDWLPCIRMGDFDRTTSTVHGVEINNLLLYTHDDAITDDDSDGLSDDFETGSFYLTSESKILVWSDDFESQLDPEEFGWNDHEYHWIPGDLYPIPLPPNPMHVWEWGEPTNAYDGLGPKEDPIKGFMDGIDGIESWEWGHTTGSVLGTRIDDDYINDLDDFVQTPEINLNNVDDARLVFWHWYDTEAGKDGGQIRVSVDGGLNYNTLGDYPGFYNCDDVTSFSTLPITAAFSGNSDGWLRAEIPLCPTYDNEVILIQFLFRSDNVNCDYPGWYIDNIRIYGSTDDQVDNTDADHVGGSHPSYTLNDGYEYYLFGTSPFIVDTDGDYLRDNLEVRYPMLNNIVILENSVPQDSEKPWYREWINNVADPQTRDIFIEFDAMAGMVPTESGNNEVQQLTDVSEVFGEHRINLHYLMSQSNIPYQANIDPTYLRGKYDDEMTPSRKRLYRWCFFGSNWGNNLGWSADAVDCRLGLLVEKMRNGGGSTMRIDDVFMHELGHCLGLDDYEFNEGWQPPNGRPPDTAMIRSVEGPTDYLGEKSDVWWKSTTPPPGYPTERYLGGWEFACREHDKSDWRPGFCYTGLEAGA